MAQDGEFWFELACDGDALLASSAPTCIAFDAAHDAVILGRSDGTLSTHEALQLGAAVTSFKAQPTRVRQVESLGAGGLLSVSDSFACIHGFGGAPYASGRLFEQDGKKLTSLLTLSPTRFVVGCDESSNGSALYEMDLTRLEQGARQFLHKFRGGGYDRGVSLLCPTALGSIVCGGTDGAVGMLDLRQGRAVGAPVKAHSGGLSDLDLCGTTLVTCGAAADGRGDPFVKLFDVRMAARTLGVLQAQAQHVRFLPGFEARAMFVSKMGGVQTYEDVRLGANARVLQMDQIQSGGGTMTGMAVSAVGHAVALSDSAGHVHLWTDDENWLSGPQLNINAFPEPIEALPPDSFSASDKNMAAPEFWSDMLEEVVNQSAFMLDTFERELEARAQGVAPPQLLSDALPPLLADKLVAQRSQREVHPDLMERAQTRRDFPGQFIETRPEEFVMNHALVFGAETSRRAYLDHATLSAADDGTPGPRSPVSRMGSAAPRTPLGTPGGGGGGVGGGTGISSAGVSSFERSMDKLLSETPPEYRQPKLTLSNIGLADFDFGRHNQTPFAGLEASVPNSFANPILQMLYFEPELRAMLKGYVSEDPNCLATEAGFLFDMLDQAQAVKSRTKSCEARNLLRAFRLAPDAQALGLLDPSQLEADERAGAFVRFLLEQFSRSHKGLKAGVAGTFGIHFVHRDKWLAQDVDDSHRTSVSLAVDIEYPHELSKAIVHDIEVPKVSFCQLLQQTFAQSKRTKLWSKQHNEQVPVVQSKTVVGFSRCLIINAASHNNRSVYLPLYREKADPSRRFVPPRFAVALSKGGGVKVSESLAKESGGGNGKTFEFELYAVVSHIYPSGHLVAHVRVPHDYAERANALSSSPPGKLSRRRASSSFAGARVEKEQWLLFNDFAVSKATEDQVLDFRSPWRNPCIFLYRVVGGAVPEPVVRPQPAPAMSDEQVFHAPSLAHKPPARATFVQLPLNKLPGKGDLVAIDCEMVALTTEESYINADGRKVVTQQSQLSLARLSCTTADETVFIDDYIVTPDPVVDYLTRFSGLVTGDLDPATSTHHLVPLRIAYLKLRRLVERGCIFVGHGLKKDFRVINIFIPPEQVRDTVHLFHLRNNRFLSLSFLASYLLQLDIQSKTHDSIEDARTALRLYKEFQRLEGNPTQLQAKLHEVYEAGRKRNFQ